MKAEADAAELRRKVEAETAEGELLLIELKKRPGLKLQRQPGFTRKRGRSNSKSSSWNGKE